MGLWKTVKAMRIEKSRYRELFFRLSVLLKGVDAVLEIAGGVALWFVSPGMIIRIVGLLTQDEIAEDPHDFIANHLRSAAGHFSLGSEHFMAVYLLGHGAIKIFAVVALLKKKLWSYPVAIVVFGGFVVYQVYRFALTGSFGLIALTAIDLIVIWFIWLEYRAMRPRQFCGP